MKIDWYLAFAWLLILVFSIILCTYYWVKNVNECTAQPLEFAVKEIRNNFDVDLVYGRVDIFKFPNSHDYIEFGDINNSKS